MFVLQRLALSRSSGVALNLAKFTRSLVVSSSATSSSFTSLSHLHQPQTATATTHNIRWNARSSFNNNNNNSIFTSIKRSYHENVIDHYENPRNVGSLDPELDTVGTGYVGAPACGDVMKLQIEVDDDGRIVDAKFKTFGCGSAIASSSLATEMLKGLSIEEAEQIQNAEIASELRLPPVKLHCSMLAEDAIKAAVKNFRSKQPPQPQQDVA
eukprot:m.223886 g.223886  ORF g.223886 m.223886 type:complete len:212 (+) comp13852_c1_seq1:423-1058(+)